MRLLFDHNVPAPLRRLLPDLDIAFADELGWAAIANGELIDAAEGAGFEVLITADQNIRYQQNLVGRRISLLVLLTNNFAILQDNAAAIIAAVGQSGVGSYQEVAFPRPPLRRRVHR